MYVKFSSKDTEDLCNALMKLANYNTSKLLSRFQYIDPTLRDSARLVYAELKQCKMVDLDAESIQVMHIASKQFTNFFNTSLEYKIRTLRYAFEAGNLKANFKTQSGLDVLIMN